MLNIRNQLDKIIITAMDRFVWFVLLVVISHLVTEFTRATSYTRGSRQEAVMVNDSLIQPIKVQNQILYPGLYEQQNQQSFNGNTLYSIYANDNGNDPNIKNNNFLSDLFKQFTNNNKQNGEQQTQAHNSGSSDKILNMSSDQGDVKTLSFRPIIDSIFEIPISTLRAVNDLLRRLTGGFLQPQQQQQQEDQQHQQLLPQQQQPPKYYSYPTYEEEISHSFYGMQKSAEAVQPKSQYEMVNRTDETTNGYKLKQ